MSYIQSLIDSCHTKNIMANLRTWEYGLNWIHFSPLEHECRRNLYHNEWDAGHCLHGAGEAILPNKYKLEVI